MAGKIISFVKAHLKIVVAVLLVVVLAGVGVGVWIVRLQQARTSYESSVSGVEQSVSGFNKRLASARVVEALGVSVEQVDDADSVSALKRVAVKRSDKPALVKGGLNVVAFDEARASNERTSARVVKASARLAGLAERVLASRTAREVRVAREGLDAKLSAARGLLSSSDGRVADASTRDGLSQAVDKAATVLADSKSEVRVLSEQSGLLDEAMSVVNASVEKKQADDAAAAAAAAAAARAAANSRSVATNRATSRVATPNRATTNRATTNNSSSNNNSQSYQEWLAASIAESERNAYSCDPTKYCPVG
ncbi:MAG: hypothetical protein Q3961_04225 [Bifidobacteriaceae bacterium]|nr:hypothetical protein [Bifidobacteriaceae bacterium]